MLKQNKHDIKVPAECMAKLDGHKCFMSATHKTTWGSTFCDRHYDKLKELIARNESPDYNWRVCTKTGCRRQSYNHVPNVAFPGNEEWLCERHWRAARMTDMVQEKPGGWTLCNICHAPLDLLDGFAQDAEGNYIAPNVHKIEEPVTCYLVTPAVVQLDQIPPCFLAGGFGVGENWHKLEHKQFLICAKCWEKLGVVPCAVACSHQNGNSPCRKPGIQHIEKDGISSWFCEEHWQDQPELVEL
jgi:hypothetical protein